MKRLLLGVLMMLYTSIQSQELGEFKPKDVSYGLNKLKKLDNKRIYIAGFDVNFQVYNEKAEYNQGGYQLGGGMKGDAETEVSVGLEGLDEKTIQQITDKLYADYVQKIREKGIAIISAEEAGKTEKYADFQKMQGGKISMAEIPGVMTSTPTNFEYFVKGLDKNGKAKKAGFLGNEAAMYAGLSKDLGDAIIGNVDITVLFVQNQNAFQGSGAKIKVKTNLRLVASDMIEMKSDAKFKMKGQNTITYATSNISFYHGKMGAASTTSYVGSLAKDMVIPNIVDDLKVTGYASGGVSQGTSTIYGTYYSPRNGKSSNARIVSVDADKYSNGVYAAAKKFLDHHMNEFLKEI